MLATLNICHASEGTGLICNFNLRLDTFGYKTPNDLIKPGQVDGLLWFKTPDHDCDTNLSNYKGLDGSYVLIAKFSNPHVWIDLAAGL